MMDDLVRRHRPVTAPVVPTPTPVGGYNFWGYQFSGTPKLDMGPWVVYCNWGVVETQPAVNGVLGPVAGSATVSPTFDLTYNISLFALGSNATTYWVGLLGCGYDSSDNVPLFVQIFGVSKADGTVTAHTGDIPLAYSPPPQAGGNILFSFWFPPRGYFNNGVATVCYAQNVEDYTSGIVTAAGKTSQMRLGVATFSFDAATGNHSSPVHHGTSLLGYWNANADWNYPIIADGLTLLANGHYAVPVTSGIFSYRDPAPGSPLGDGRTNCWVAIVSPTSGVVHVVEVHPSHPSYWGAMSTLPVDGGFLVSASIVYNHANDETQDPAGIVGDWRLQRWSYTGAGAPTKTHDVQFTNNDYYWYYGKEAFFGGFFGGAAHVTQMFGGPTSGVLVTWEEGYRWVALRPNFREFTWSTAGGGLTVTEVGVTYPFPAEQPFYGVRETYNRMEFDHRAQLDGGYRTLYAEFLHLPRYIAFSYLPPV